MIDLTSWLKSFLSSLENTFGERIWFVGLQGSYGRGEATDASDIDLVVILDEVTFPDILKYNSMLDELSNRKLICGFLSGKSELLAWEASDLFQFYYDTKPIKGSLDELLVRIDTAAVRHAIQTGACNIYHACVHNLLYEKSDEILKNLYKAACFVLQAIYFQQTGQYISRHADLSKRLNGSEREIVETYQELKAGRAADVNSMSEMLFTWAKKWVCQ